MFINYKEDIDNFAIADAILTQPDILTQPAIRGMEARFF
jgi:hypothetical protein